MIASRPEDILRFLCDCREAGQGAVLVTLVGLEGSSSRAIGAQMAVAEDGRHLGSFSGGCVEAAVVAEALDALACAAARQVRFGVDSPYLDIRLPCGGGIDLLFNPDPDVAAIAGVLERLVRRRPAVLSLSPDGAELADPIRLPDPGWRGDRFLLPFTPALRIIAIGQGEDLTAFARLARGFGAGVLALSPDPAALVELPAEGIEVVPLVSRNVLPAIAGDDWTAIVFLFHDRDWEDGLLPQALALPNFYFGAVGSMRTHRARKDRLRAAGVPESLLEGFRGPIGLIPATRTPAALALSILSEVVAEYDLSRFRQTVSEGGSAPALQGEPVALG